MKQSYASNYLLMFYPYSVFCDKVIDAAAPGFYREMAQLTKELIQFDLEQINKSLRQTGH